MDNKLTEFQNKLLEMFSWFHQFCVENNLKYYSLGGTMLGAVRHEGFIPWDDDIDVGMPRSDYDRLLKIFSEKNNSHFILESPKDGNKDYLYSYAKLYDTNTTLVENTRKKIKRGIFLDIFPLDGIGNTKDESIKNYKKILPYLDFLSLRSCAIRKDRKLYKNLAIIISRCFPEFLYSNRKILNKIDLLSRKNFYETSNFISNIDGNWRQREIMEKEIFGEPKLYNFNGLQIFGVQDFDKYLTNMYGDWRQLPPIEKQVTHHDFLEFNLNKSYLD